MELTPRRHELLCTYMLGLGTLFLYIGYSAQAFISESVMHMEHTRSPDVISGYAGYYGMALHYSVFAVASLVTPSLQHYMPSKWILTVASALFAAFYLGFLRINAIYFYVSQALMGIGYSFYNNGEGAYLSEHSSRRTIESNTGIETAVGHFSMFFGGVALIGLFLAMPSMSMPSVAAAKTSSAVMTFTDDQIKWIYGTMFLLNSVSVIIFALLPTKQYDSIASKSSSPIPSIKEQIKQLFAAFKAKNMMMLTPFFIFQGLSVSFLMSVYPTTLTFTAALSGDVFLIGIYSIALGIAEAIGGIFLRPLVKKAKQYGLLMTITVNFLVYAAVIVLLCLSVPNSAPLGPTDEQPLLFNSSRLLVFLIGFLIGFCDFCVTMARAVVCQVAVPECRMQVFSLSKIYQSAASVAALLLAPNMGTFVWAGTLAGSLVVGSAGYVVVARRISQSSSHQVTPSALRELADKI